MLRLTLALAAAAALVGASPGYTHSSHQHPTNGGMPAMPGMSSHDHPAGGQGSQGTAPASHNHGRVAATPSKPVRLTVIAAFAGLILVIMAAAAAARHHPRLATGRR